MGGLHEDHEHVGRAVVITMDTTFGVGSYTETILKDSRGRVTSVLPGTGQSGLWYSVLLNDGRERTFCSGGSDRIKQFRLVSALEELAGAAE